MDLTIAAPDFDLEKTLNSGQVCHWTVGDGGFYGLIDDLPIFVQQRKRTLLLKVASAAGRCAADHSRDGGTDATPRDRSQDANSKIAHYFALDHRLTEICRSF